MSKARDPEKLTPKEALFVRHYPLCGMNGTQAAIAAGYSDKCAKVTACQIMKRPRVRAALDQLMTSGLNTLDITVERVLKERARLAFFDPRKLLDNTGRPLAIQDLDDDTAAAIAGVKVRDEYEQAEGGGEGKASTVVEYKLADKSASLTALEKHLGMYRDDTEPPGIFNIIIHMEQNNGKAKT